MTEKQFWTLINEIQTFMWLDNWEITHEITKIDDDTDAYCTSILYPYFKWNIAFDKKILKRKDDAIIHIIFHELSHIYTTQWLKTFEDEEDFITWWMWNNAFQFIKEKMIIVNEQQTELLARRFKELYLLSKKKWK